MTTTKCSYQYVIKGWGLLICLLTLALSPAWANDGLKGWEIDSAYNQLYDASEMDAFKGTVRAFKKITPLNGMAPGVGVVVRDRDGEDIMVHLCPVAYRAENQIGVKKGDRVKLKGVWVEINGQDVFIASKIKRGDYFEFKVRLTKNGKPFWTMTPEELAQEGVTR
jgi:hypothetical protein